MRKYGRILFPLFFVFVSIRASFGADDGSRDGEGWKWLQGGLTFRPAAASVFEPRVGFIFYGDRNNIRLDIGSGIDLLSRAYRGGNLALGAEFFTYTLLESWANMHFPVIVSDYFFGVNLSYSKATGSAIFSWRLRFTHISAHFVDGQYDSGTGAWRNGIEPIVYSREFFELLLSHQRNGSTVHRWYGGPQYIINITPEGPGRFALQGGYEIFLPTYLRFVTPYAAYDFRLIEIGDWNINHSIQAGVKFGHRFGRGLDIFLSYYDGFNVHGQFFDETISYWGFGFNVQI